jgi:hypothetical protein
MVNFSFFRELFRIDLRAVGAFRVALGVITLVDGIFRLSEFEAHYSASGVFPVTASILDHLSRGGGDLHWSVMFWNHSDAWQFLCIVCYAAGGLMLASQKFPLAGALIAWVFQLSLMNRLPYINNGGDALLRLLLFWNLLLSLQIRISPPRAGERSVSGVAAAGLLLQMCLMYWFTALLKCHPVWRTDFTAVRDALHIGSLATPFGVWLGQHELLTYWATRGTIWLEEFGPFVALASGGWWRARAITALTFISFHLILLASTMSIGLFPFVCATGWLVFLPAQFWNYLEGLCGRDRNYFPPQHRRLPTWLEVARPAVSGIGIIALLYVLAWNVRSLFPDKVDTWFKGAIRAPGVVLGLRQRWNLFAVRPSTLDGWMLAVARLESGATVDLLTTEPPRWHEPLANVAGHYPNTRWRKHLVGMFSRRQPAVTKSFHKYLIHRWNRGNADQVKDLKLIFCYRDALSPSAGILQSEVYPAWTKPARASPERPEQSNQNADPPDDN